MSITYIFIIFPISNRYHYYFIHDIIFISIQLDIAKHFFISTEFKPLNVHLKSRLRQPKPTLYKHEKPSPGTRHSDMKTLIYTDLNFYFIIAAKGPPIANGIYSIDAITRSAFGASPRIILFIYSTGRN